MKKVILLVLVIVALTGCDLFPVEPESTYLKTLAIHDGVGVGNFSLADGTIEEMKAIYGEPDLTTTNSKLDTPVYHYNNLGIKLHKAVEYKSFSGIESKSWSGVIFQSPYQGKTKRGIGIGDPRTKVFTAYGNSDDLDDIFLYGLLVFGLELGEVRMGQTVSYKSQGILFICDDSFFGNVDLIIIFEPQSDN